MIYAIGQIGTTMIEFRWKRLINGHERADHSGAPWLKDDDAFYVLQVREGEWFTPYGKTEVTSHVPQAGFQFRWKEWHDIPVADAYGTT